MEIQIPKNEPYVWAVIYIWYNTINGKAYIGQTTDEKNRYRKHIEESFNPNSRGYNLHLHRAIRKYGVDNFRYMRIFKKSLPKCLAREILNRAEIYFVEKYNTFHNGYNMTIGGDGVSGHCWTEEERKHQSEMIKGKFVGKLNPMYGTTWNDKQREGNQTKVIKYTLDNEFVCEYDSLNEAAKSVNKNHSGNISNCCRGKRNNAYGFKWKYKEQDGR